MSNKAITTNDLKAVLDVVLPPQPSEYRKLLWTNPNPTSSFAAQTISLDLSDYDAIEIIIRADTANTYTLAPIVTEVGKGGTAYVSTAYNSNRSFTSSTSGVTFTAASYHSAYGNWSTTSTNALIPVYIYGIKYERVNPPQVEIADVVVEQGTSSSWTYRKWNSGIAECWATFTDSASATQHNYNGTFPITFIEKPTMVASGGNVANVDSGVRYASCTTTTYDVYTTGTWSNTGFVQIYTIGRWK